MATTSSVRSIARERQPLSRTGTGAASPAGRNRADAMTEAALTLFAERNFASVTIKDIGTALGVNTALIYYYFDSKEDLFRAAIERAVQRAFLHFRELRLRHSNPADILSDWLDNHVDLHDPIQKLVKVSLDYAGLPVELPEVERSIRQFYDEEYHTLSRCIQDGIDLGLFEPVDAGRTAQWISIWLDGLMVRSKIFPDLDVEAAINSLREMLWTHLGYRRQPAAT